MPAELWVKLLPEKRKMFESAQAILDDLLEDNGTPIAELCVRLDRTLNELIAPLRLLKALELIEVGPGATLRVIAIPDEPLHVQGPDGRWRWIFVKRRLTHPSELERAVWH
jgi:hypothetical protein